MDVKSIKAHILLVPSLEAVTGKNYELAIVFATSFAHNSLAVSEIRL